MDYLQKLFEEMEMDSFYELFMHVLNHSLLDTKVKFLAIFKPSDFEEGAELHQFKNIISLMELKRFGIKTFLVPQNYNPKIDQLKNGANKKFLKALHLSV